ncbi:MAG: 50S ribosomal protein L29 [Rikenellaceae bacterium]|jgi:large subunit ribosomal protein L29|nr:50S ribosomal protein L29 [Rikenellaceae bacterium]
MKISEIKEMPEKELIERLESTRAELARLKINHAISPVEDSTTITKTRKDIARMLTVLREKQN